MNQNKSIIQSNPYLIIKSTFNQFLFWILKSETLNSKIRNVISITNSKTKIWEQKNKLKSEKRWIQNSIHLFNLDFVNWFLRFSSPWIRNNKQNSDRHRKRQNKKMKRKDRERDEEKKTKTRELANDKFWVHLGYLNGLRSKGNICEL